MAESSKILVRVEEVAVLYVTDDAILIHRNPDLWVPKTLIEPQTKEDLGDDPDKGDEGSLVIPKWKADELELEYEEI